MKWNIENGVSFNLWSQPWLNSAHGSYVESPSPLGFDSLTVGHLINHQTQEWWDNLIENIFNQQDVIAIRSIPLLNLVEDSWFGNFHKNVAYTVRTSCHCIMDNLLQTEHLKINRNWSTVWSLNIPPKIKHFVWRSLKDCLPTRQRFLSKEVSYSPSCCFCYHVYENEWHLFICCEKAKQIWTATGLWNDTQ